MRVSISWELPSIQIQVTEVGIIFQGSNYDIHIQ